jgi:hypothetical protein
MLLLPQSIRYDLEDAIALKTIVVPILLMTYYKVILKKIKK